MKWKQKFIWSDTSGNEAIGNRLARFLNDNNITEFHIVKITDDVIEIIYK